MLLIGSLLFSILEGVFLLTPLEVGGNSLELKQPWTTWMESSQIPYAFPVIIIESSDKAGLSAKYLKNRSFTKGEIEAYWRLKKRKEEEHLRTLPDLQETSQIWLDFQQVLLGGFLIIGTVKLQ
ncbi:hypothetical protein NE237_019319 [Protea cynaroides]|uniref:Uncharacterized protein n=1 Tax=Protea cynaroides TaxID=273540 RepID=A0A9Q0QPV6_9MAGN|nr:hypothetical protein NE237_019319 [Protea cynaroides]